MDRFFYHRDGLVIVENGGAIYIDTPQNFAADSGAPLAAPVGFEFVPGQVNKVNNGRDDLPGLADVTDYAAHIANVAQLVAAKQARETAAAAAARAAYLASQEGINATAKAALVKLDLESIRSLREYIAAKPDAPQFLKDKEAAAQAERTKIK